MQLAILGDGGLGREVEAAASAEGHGVRLFGRPPDGRHLPGLLRGADIVVEASRPEAVLSNVTVAADGGCRRVVIATTGWAAERPSVEALLRERGVAAVAASNFSLGMALFGRLVDAAVDLYGAVPAFDRVARERGVALGFAAHSSCRPLPGVSSAMRRDRYLKGCIEFNEAMFGVIEREKPELVILAAHWSEPGDRFLSSGEHAPPGVSIFSVGLERTLARIAKTGARACVVLDVPELKYPYPHALLTVRQRGIDESFLMLTREEAHAGQAAVERDVRALARRYPVDIVDPKDALCATGRCEIGDGRISFYRDDNHLTVAGAERVTPIIDGCFASLTE